MSRSRFERANNFVVGKELGYNSDENAKQGFYTPMNAEK